MQSESAREPYRINVEPSTSSYTHPQSGTRNQLSKIVRILLPISGRFVRAYGLRPHSAKTYENSARGACAEKRMSFRCRSRRHLSVVFRCSRKMDELLRSTLTAATPCSPIGKNGVPGSVT